MTDPLTFTAPLWQWQAREQRGDGGAWFFVTVPRELSEEIRDQLTGPPRGFGSVRVAVSAGSSQWETSVFPDGDTGCFVLPVKKAVRVAQGVDEGDDLTVTLRVRDP
jgi:hypothetical protein